jgi:hypothetical protein
LNLLETRAQKEDAAQQSGQGVTLSAAMAIAGTAIRYLVSSRQQRFRDGEAEGFGGLEVDDEFEFGR